MTDPAITDPPKVEDPPAGDHPKVDPPAPADPPKDDFDKDRAMATIKAQREAEDRLKAELKEAKKAEAELQKIKDEQKTEFERTTEERDKLKADHEAAQAALRDARLQVALTKPELAVVDPETAATLLKERGLTFAEDGSPENLTEAVTALLEAKPFLRGGPAETPKPNVPNIDAGAGQGNGPAPTLSAEELDMARQLGQDPVLFAELKRESEANGGVLTHESYKAAVDRANAAGAT